MSETNEMNLGQRILELRTKKGWSQNYLAERVGTTRTTVSKWETGDSEPGASQLTLMAKAFGISLDYLCGNTEKNGEKVCVLDTCVVLNRPRIIESLLSDDTKIYDKIVIPDVVIQELNYQKDNAKGSIKQRAWLTMSTIEKNKSKISIDSTEYIKGEINDDRIISVGKTYALDSVNNIVDILTNDVYFSLKHSFLGVKNLSIKSVSEIEAALHKDDGFDEYDTQKFIGAVKTKRLNEVKMAYKKSVDLNRRDSLSGYTPLIQAIRDKSYDIVEYLLGLNGVDVDKRDDAKYGFTPLLNCCQMRDTRIMSMLLENGANINASSRNKQNPGNTPLMVCAWGGFNEGIKILMENESLSYNQQDNNGFTALHKACIRKNTVAIELLCNKIDNKIEDFKNRKAMEYLDRHSPDYERISKMFAK